MVEEVFRDGGFGELDLFDSVTIKEFLGDFPRSINSSCSVYQVDSMQSTFEIRLKEFKEFSNFLG